MNTITRNTKALLRHRKRAQIFNGWIVGPVFLSNMMFLAIAINQSDLAGLYQEYPFLDATAKMAQLVIEACAF